MNKLLLSFATAVVALTGSQAQAGDVIYDVSGDMKMFSMDYQYTDQGQLVERYGVKSKVCFDKNGTDVYFYDLMPTFTGGTIGTWLKGTLADGVISVPSGQTMSKEYNFSGFTEMEFRTYRISATDGTLSDEDCVQFNYDGTTITPADDYVCLGAYDTAADDLYMVSNNHVLTLVTESSAKLPSGVAPKQYFYSYNDGDVVRYRLAKVAQSGSDIWFSGFSLSAPNDYVKGTISGNEVTMPSRQWMDGNATNYYLVSGAIDDGYDPAGQQVMVVKNSITFDMVDGVNEMKVCDKGLVVETDPEFKTTPKVLSEMRMKAYPGDKPAKPATPSELRYEEQYGIYKFFELYMPNCDVDGNYINPKLMTYRLYLDGNIYEFTPEGNHYYQLGKATTEMPYTFDDAWSVFEYYGKKIVYVYNTEDWEKAEFEVVYTVNGVTNVSDRVSCTPTEPSGVATVDADREVKCKDYYDICGRRLSEPKGLCIEKITYTDGSFSTMKKVVR